MKFLLWLAAMTALLLASVTVAAALALGASALLAIPLAALLIASFELAWFPVRALARRSSS